jgi:hypothetical protein
MRSNKKCKKGKNNKHENEKQQTWRGGLITSMRREKQQVWWGETTNTNKRTTINATRKIIRSVMRIAITSVKMKTTSIVKKTIGSGAKMQCGAQAIT